MYIYRTDREYITFIKEIINMKKVNIKDTTLMCGIYLIEYPNNKVYIGQAQNIHLRILEHNSRARVGKRGDGKELQLCDKKIQKYFPNGVENYIVLEECPLNELDLKEDYWISHYNALNKNKGYNFLDKGNVSDRRGVDNINASINADQLKAIVSLLQNNYELSYQDIANQVGASLNVVQNINWGTRYVNPYLIYPLRKPNTHVSTRKDKIEDYFKNKEELLLLKEDLKWSWWLSIETDLVSKYNIPLKIMHDINTGKKFENIGNYTYPIRNKNIKNKNNLSKKDIIELLDDLKNTTMSMTEIGNKYGFGRGVISKINKGENYPIKNYNYPARKTN